MLLYMIRHGDPDYSTDTLTERGWQQAEAVGKRIAAFTTSSAGMVYWPSVSSLSVSLVPPTMTV